MPGSVDVCAAAQRVGAYYGKREIKCESKWARNQGRSTRCRPHRHQAPILHLMQHQWGCREPGTPGLRGTPDLDLHSTRRWQLPCSPAELTNCLSHDKSFQMKMIYVFKKQFH